jgi:virginiamycin B lyase
MRKNVMAAVAALIVAGGVGTASGAEPRVDFWEVPWEDTRPRDPAVAADGRIWFVGQAGDYVAVFDPRTARFRRFDLEAGTGPHNLIIGEDGMVWYAGNRAGHIGRLDPGNGSIEKVGLPKEVSDPHTLAGDGAGHIWFTAQRANFVGRLTLRGRKVEVVRVPTSGALPYGIAVDGDGRPWVNLLGTGKVATVDPQSMQLEEIALPREQARTRRIASDRQGNVWFVDYAGGFLGRLEPKSRGIREWPLPSGPGSRPYAMAIDDRGQLWIAESGPQPNRMVAFDPVAARFVAGFPLAEARGAVRHMVFDAKTRALWFGTDTGYLGRVRVD